MPLLVADPFFYCVAIPPLLMGIGKAASASAWARSRSYFRWHWR
jgi:hypothetical protein